METITNVLERRDSFDKLLRDILYPIKPEYADAIGSARSYWNSLSIEKQRQIYYTLRWQKIRKQPIKENPRFAIEDCHPAPFNWNGHPGLNEQMRNEKMVSAKYYDKYGIYYAIEADIFGMTDIKPLN